MCSYSYRFTEQNMEESLAGGFNATQGSCHDRSEVKRHGDLLGPRPEQEVNPGM